MMAAGSEDLELNATLEYTQGIRRNVIGQLMAGGKMPEDISSRALLVAMLDGSDRTAIQKSKLKIDSEDSKSKAKMAAALVEIQRQNRDRKVADRLGEVPSLDAEFKVDNPVPGETATETEELTYDKFMLTGEVE